MVAANIIHPLIILFVSVESDYKILENVGFLAWIFYGFLIGTGELLFETLGRAARVPWMGIWWTVDGLMLASMRLGRTGNCVSRVDVWSIIIWPDRKFQFQLFQM